ncbi:SDR family oxidoreductase [Sabulicella glaciei]|uniref:SDR family oxidoreductase n=1 Tax=Sabulicella glaciei TaxID=2984948 RepID=A0ABT3NQR3_9PROT|nr:SDR family oxidoreductase [Roseococcus sp. MDT2-1-1]MCW8084490.1 SDR family oxidoreductase [Roseococcus sp. MDT2-1-1]
MDRHLLILGGGFSGSAVATLARRAGWRVSVSTRRPPAEGERPFGDPVLLDGITHLLSTVPPGEEGDPAWAAHGPALRGARLEWAGYLSTTGVYGDRGGAAVDEEAAPAPGQPRSQRRLAAEEQWQALRCSLDVFRVGGIYGPGRSALDDLRQGTARRVERSGHRFGRIHRDDIARACLAAMTRPGGKRVLHLVDDEPAEPARVTEEAARLLGIDPPPLVSFAEAWKGMSPMARSFWAESRTVLNRRTKAVLGLDWLYPSFREGLRAILAEQRADGAAEQQKVAGR